MPIPIWSAVQVCAAQMCWRILVSNPPGVFCVSVDSHTVESDSAALKKRRQDLLEIFQRFDLPSNWTVSTPPKRELPPNFEISVALPKQLSRSELVLHIRRMNAELAENGLHTQSVVLDPHEARSMWDVLVRQGCHVARPRTATACLDTTAKVIRGGLWYAPLSCSFVGGSRRSVRSSFSVCQQRLVATAGNGGLFHLNIDVGNARDSWNEEVDALRALVQTSADLRAKQRMQCVTLSSVPASLLRKTSSPMNSILRRAA